MIVQRHVFGSIKGYRTLAKSPSMSDEQCRLLAGFSFGQPQTQGYLDSLTKNPAYWIRPLGSRQRALTRMMPGAPDDRGRVTVLLITAVVSSSDWDNVLRGDVSLLLRVKQLWQWNGDSQLEPMKVSVSQPATISVSRSSAEKLLDLVSIVERNFGKKRSIAVRETDVTPEEARSLEMLIPPSVRFGFGLAYRSLNGRLGATINCVAENISLDPGTEVYTPGQGIRRSFYAGVLKDAGFCDGSVDTAFVHEYTGFGKFAKSPPGAPPSAAASQPVIIVPAPQLRSRVAMLAGWAMSAVLLVAIVWLWYQEPIEQPAAMTPDTPKATTLATQQPSQHPTQPPSVAVQWDKLASATQGLLQSKPLPSNEQDRNRVMKKLEELVDGFPKGAIDAHGLKQLLETTKHDARERSRDEKSRRRERVTKTNGIRDAVDKALLNATTNDPIDMGVLLSVHRQLGLYEQLVGRNDKLYRHRLGEADELTKEIRDDGRELEELIGSLVTECKKFLKGDGDAEALRNSIEAVEDSLLTSKTIAPVASLAEAAVALATAVRQPSGREVVLKTYKERSEVLEEALKKAVKLLEEFDSYLDNRKVMSPFFLMEAQESIKRLNKIADPPGPPEEDGDGTAPKEGGGETGSG